MKRLFLLAILAFVGSMVYTQERIAVFPFEDLDKVFTGNQSFMFYQEFSNAFKNRMPNRSVVERLDVERLITIEANFQLSNFSAREKTAEMNRVLNGNQILSGYIARVDNHIRITVCLFTYPELDRLPGGISKSVSNITELFNVIPELVRDMQERIAREGSGTGSTTKTYKVGDTGPAGGIVFYDRGFVADGWRYLEAAPTDFTAIWGVHGQYISGTDTVIGSGRRNTQIIVEYLNRIGERNRAAQICATMDVNGYKDWFLPSKDELDFIYKNLKQKSLGGFSDNSYWSSSQPDYSIAWGQDFSDGYQLDGYMYGTCSVRAVRAF